MSRAYKFKNLYAGAWFQCLVDCILLLFDCKELEAFCLGTDPSHGLRMTPWLEVSAVTPIWLVVSKYFNLIKRQGQAFGGAAGFEEFIQFHRVGGVALLV